MCGVQARARFAGCAPLQIVRVECAKCRRECDLQAVRATLWRLCSTTLVRGVSAELEDENWRLCSTTSVRGVSRELEDENWRLGSATLARGAIFGAGS